MPLSVDGAGNVAVKAHVAERGGAMRSCSWRHARAGRADELVLIGLAWKWWWSRLIMMVAVRGWPHRV